MQSPAHFVIGAAICRYTKWRPGGIVLAVASHFVIDALPHFEDPSIVPGSVGQALARVWSAVLILMPVLLVPLGCLVWRRFRGPRAADATAIYLIAGGLVACLLDAVTLFLGPDTPIGTWNRGSHMVWFPTYYRLLFSHRPWRPAIALFCLVMETTTFVAGAALLFRKGRRSGSRDAER